MSMDPTEVLTVPLTFFTICGLWRQENKFYWPYIIYAGIFQFIFLICYTGFKCLNFLFLTDANAITKELFICCRELSLVVKVINFHYHHSEIKHFLIKIKSFKLQTVLEEEILKERLAKFTMILKFQVTCTIIAIAFSCLAPFFAKEPVLP